MFKLCCSFTPAIPRSIESEAPRLCLPHRQEADHVMCINESPVTFALHVPRLVVLTFLLFSNLSTFVSCTSGHSKWGKHAKDKGYVTSNYLPRERLVESISVYGKNITVSRQHTEFW
jgi:hypothetical protein